MARGEIVRVREEQSALLLDTETGRRPGGGCAVEALAAAGRDPVKMAVERAAKFIVRGLLILLGVYLFNSMKRYAINYTGEDTWFSTFTVIVVAVPIAEILCILGQTLIAPLLPVRSLTLTPCRGCVCACTTAANGKVTKEEVDPLFLDLEESVNYTTAPVQADVKTKIAGMVGMTNAHREALDKETARIIKCIIRGLLALLWVYLVDLLRRFVTTHCVEEIIFTICPLGILAVSVSALFCFLMESIGESFL
ncbi:unnamed protein product [Urochloa humidicola]